MPEWMEWTEVDWGKRLRHKWVKLSVTRGYGVPGPSIPYIHLADELTQERLDSISAVSEANGELMDAMPGWCIVDATTRKQTLAGPFDSLAAAKAAYLMLVEV